MSRNRTLYLAIGLAGVLAGGTALAEEPKLLTPYGMSVSVGGGVIGFADEATRDFADVGGTWDARFTFGTRKLIGIEAAYLGAAQSIDALGLEGSPILLASGAEAALRLNLLEHEWQPFIMAGAGWKRYDLTNADTNTSSVAEYDNVFEIPVGLGVAYRYSGLVVEARGIFRAAFDADLIGTTAADEAEKTLDSIEGHVGVGWEF